MTESNLWLSDFLIRVFTLGCEYHTKAFPYIKISKTPRESFCSFTVLADKPTSCSLSPSLSSLSAPPILQRDGTPRHTTVQSNKQTMPCYPVDRILTVIVCVPSPIAMKRSITRRWRNYHANTLLKRFLPGYLLVMYFLPSVKDL